MFLAFDKIGQEFEERKQQDQRDEHQDRCPSDDAVPRQQPAERFRLRGYVGHRPALRA